MGHLKRICKDGFRVAGRQKFRSQTPDKMDRWKSRGGKSQRREGRKKEDQRRERGRRQKMQVCEKVVAKSGNILFSQWFVALEGRKVGSLKRRVPSGWEMKSCTPLWREAYFEIKMCKTHQVRSTFGSWDVEGKCARRCGAKHISNQNVQNTPCPEQCEANFEVKMYKTHHARSAFGSWDDEKMHAVVARSTCPSQNLKNK